MEVVCWILWFLVTVATLWDIRRCSRRSRAILGRVEAMSAEVLRRTPEH